MRSKLLIGGLGAAVAFLLATSPVVAQAAGFITSADIVNNTIKGKDVKDSGLKGKDIKDASLTNADVADGSLTGADVANGSLTSADLAAGTIPTVAPEITQFKRFASSGFTAVTATLAFVGSQATVTVDGNDIIAASGSLLVFGNTTGDDFNYGLCYRPAGSLAVPTVLGGTSALFTDVDVVNGDNSNSMDASDVLPAGSYTVGACAQIVTGGVSYEKVSGTVSVLSGATGAIGRPSVGAPRPANLP